MWTKEKLKLAAETWISEHPEENLMEAFTQGAKFILDNTQKENE